MYLGRLIIALILLLCAIILIPIIYCSQDLILIIIGTICILIIIIQFGFFASYQFKVVSGDWGQLIDTSQVNVERISIPMPGNFNMVGVLLAPKSIQSSKKLPGIIVHHGVMAKKEFIYNFALPLALNGYLVLVTDARGHGETKKSKAKPGHWVIGENEGIFPDFPHVINYFLHNPQVDPNRVAVMGHSMGGTITLTKALIDPRIKLCIALSPLYSFTNIINSIKGVKFLGEQWISINFLRFVLDFGFLQKIEAKFSPKFYFDQPNRAELAKKVRLVHCEDDELLVFDYHAKLIQQDLNLSPDQVFFLKKGGHNFRGQETLVMSRILAWLTDYFSSKTD